jgi:uncharacterized protein YukE
MKFDLPNIYKWAVNLESTLTDRAEEEIQAWFDVESTEDLTAEQIEEIESFISKHEENWYGHVLVGFQNVIDSWENAHYDD